MKKTVLSVLSVSLVVVMLLALVACGGGYNGTYTDASGMTSFKLSGSKFSALLGEVELYSGTFEVDGNKITMTYEFMGIESTMSGTIDGDTLVVDGVTYTK